MFKIEYQEKRNVRKFQLSLKLNDAHSKEAWPQTERIFLYFYTSLYNFDFNLNDFELNVFFFGPKCVQFEALLY